MTVSTNSADSLSNTLICQYTPDKCTCRRAHLVPLLLLMLLLLIIYANSFNGTWFFDDEPNIVENSAVHLESLDGDSLSQTFYGITGKSLNRPLAFLSFGINYLVHGLDTWGYHLVNFIIHCLASVFLYFFVFQVLHLPKFKENFSGQAGSIALLTAVLWATNPIQVTAVTYIVQRMASMSAMFFIMAMSFYLKGKTTQGLKNKSLWFALCGVSGILSMASKENAAMLPLTLYMLDLLFFQEITPKTLKRHLLFGLIPVLCLIGLSFIMSDPLTVFSSYDIRDFTLIERLLTQPRVMLSYLSMMLYPISDQFALVHEVQVSTSLLTPWTTLPAILFWMIWFGTGLALLKKHPLIAFCLLFFIVNHLIESTILPLELVYEHRNYLPSMTVFLLLALSIISLLQFFRQKYLIRFLILAILFVTIAGQGYTVIQRNALFAHPLLLWSDNAQKSPGLSRVYIYLGNAFGEVNQHEDAKHSNILAIKADRYPNKYLRAIPYYNLGNHYLRTGQLNKAVSNYSKALSLNEKYWKSLMGLTISKILLDQLEEASLQAKHLVLIGVKIKNNQLKSQALSLQALILLKQEKYLRSTQTAKAALSVDLNNATALKILGKLSLLTGDYITALQYWKKFSSINPDELEGVFAQLYLADKLNDDKLLNHIVVKLLLKRKKQSWGQFFTKYQRDTKNNLIVFLIEPQKLQPIINRSIKMMVDELTFCCQGV